MVVLIQQYLQPPFLSSKRSKAARACTSSSSTMDRRGGFMEFPYLSVPHRSLMVDLVSTMETRLGSHLHPSSLPEDVQYFQNESGSSQGTLHIRSGNHSSEVLVHMLKLPDCTILPPACHLMSSEHFHFPTHRLTHVDFILGSWIHSKLPSGALNITTLTAYLNSKTDAPRFLLEFIQSSPSSLILILDLPHRKDLILYQDYLNTFYVDTELDQFRKELDKLPETQPYFSSSLYIRCALSPTAVSVLIDCGASGSGRMDEIIVEHVGPVAKRLLEIWLDKCACGGRELDEQERVDLEKRDALVSKKTLDIDLASGLPRLFGPDVASRVITGIQKYFKV